MDRRKHLVDMQGVGCLVYILHVKTVSPTCCHVTQIDIYLSANTRVLRVNIQVAETYILNYYLNLKIKVDKQ